MIKKAGATVDIGLDAPNDTERLESGSVIPSALGLSALMRLPTPTALIVETMLRRSTRTPLSNKEGLVIVGVATVTTTGEADQMSRQSWDHPYAVRASGN